jgi:hypothetical protein
VLHLTRYGSFSQNTNDLEENQSIKGNDLPPNGQYTTVPSFRALTAFCHPRIEYSTYYEIVTTTSLEYKKVNCNQAYIIYYTSS